MDFNINYLTEKVLYQLLKLNFSDLSIFNSFPKRGDESEKIALKYGIKNFNKKYDIGFEYKNKLYLVEFDGYAHYTKPNQILKDYNFRENIDESIIYISIPYFIQLNKYTIPVLFPFTFDILEVNGIDYSKFPCGFWSDKAIYEQTPAFFCRLGYERYINDLKKFPLEVEEEIISSLKRGETELGINKLLLY